VTQLVLEGRMIHLNLKGIFWAYLIS